MNSIQRIVLIIGCIVFIANLLYAPRTYEYNTEASVPRAFIFSDSFYKADITPMNEERGSIMIVETSNPAVLNKDLMWITSAAIAAMTLAICVCAGWFQSATKPSSQHITS